MVFSVHSLLLGSALSNRHSLRDDDVDDHDLRRLMPVEWPFSK